MERPRDDTPDIDLIEHSAFTIAAVGADDDVAGQEQGLAGAHAALKQSVRDAEDQHEERLKRRAVLMVKDRRLDGVVRDFELGLFALVKKHREDPLYRRYFPHGLRDVTEAEPRVAEPARVDAMIQAMGEDAGKPGIGPLAQEYAPRLQAAVDEVRAAAKDLAGVEAKLSYLRTTTIPGLRASWVDEYVKLHGALKVAMPREPQRLEAFFLPFRKERAKAETTTNNGQPAGSPTQPSTGAQPSTGDAQPSAGAQPTSGTPPTNGTP